jgi:hypothetical protein
VFVTTSDFSAEAKNDLSEVPHRVVLIGGSELARQRGPVGGQANTGQVQPGAGPSFQTLCRSSPICFSFTADEAARQGHGK